MMSSDERLAGIAEGSRQVIEAGEHFLGRSGLQMTSGGEVEWYRLVPGGRGHGIDYYRRHLEDLLAQGRWQDFARHHLVAMDRMFLDMAPAKSILAAETRLANADHSLLRDSWWRHRILTHCEEESIDLLDFKKEQGTVMPHGFSQPMGDSGIRLQQYEIITHMAGPTETMRRIDRIRAIVNEESERLGMISCFESDPTQAIAMQVGRHIKPSETNGGHVHYGLRDLAENNRMIDENRQFNRLAENIETQMLMLLGSGGCYLANPYLNDYDRLRDGSPLAPKQFGKGKDRGLALRLIQDEKDPDNAHHELRLPGAQTPAAMQLAVPMLAIVAALADVAGVSPPRACWAARTPPKTADRLEALGDRFDDAARERLAEAMAAPALGVVSPVRQAPIRREDAHVPLGESIIARYAPELYAQMPKQLRSPQR